VLHALQEGKYVDAPVVFQNGRCGPEGEPPAESAMCRPSALTRGTPPGRWARPAGVRQDKSVDNAAR